jgi:hypothetical protein
VEEAAQAARLNPSLQEVVTGDIECLPSETLPTNCDVVIASHVLEHLRDPWLTVVRLVKCMRPAGRFVGAVPNAQWLGLSGRLLLGKWEYKPQGVMDWTHLRWFTRRSMIAALRAIGLIDIHTRFSIHSPKHSRLDYLSLGLFRSWLADTLWFKAVKPSGWQPPQGSSVYPFPIHLGENEAG